MSALRELARPMLASIFVLQGLHNFQDPAGVSPLAEPVVKPLRERVPALPAETEHAVRINGAVQATAGTMLGLGLLPRLAALVMAGTLVPTTLAGHRFWEIQDPKERAQQRIHFLNKMTMMGGLLLAIADTDGRPSFSWRRRHAARVANGYLAAMTQAVTGAAEQFADAAQAAAAPAKRG
jgi:putative oxidoreductase